MKHSLHHPRIWRIFACAGIVVVAAVVGLSISSPSSHNHASAATVATLQPLAISAAPASVLATHGIEIYQPSTTDPAISAAAADAIATSVYGANSVQSTVLATVSGVPGTNEPTLFWVVSVMPAGGLGSADLPAGSSLPDPANTICLEFVNPTTGSAGYSIEW